LGGVALFVRKSIVEKCVSKPELVEWVPGRAASLTLCFEEDSITTNNVHQFDLNAKLLNSVTSKVNATVVKARADPSARSVAFTVGDWNFNAPSEVASRLGISVKGDPGVEESGKHRNLQKKWELAIGGCLEFYQPEPTRIATVTNIKIQKISHHHAL
jgi:hypothetical protein